ncbi:(4Fe-4S)-binding protein [Gaetbulibacter saemankumensis]|uniref:(4Fe-4S)-binding protein n=1 Tax=Gaetbulibacter saemankumensis TaxID=311208 RepID=UPI0003FF674F|nr:(4Fe-4S)-binding protein [Gaetbulibacter saemankumensis]
MGKTKEYSNGEITIVWEAKKCIHSGICVKGLPNVFRPSLRPWIKMDGAETETLVNQVKQCPSGALSSYINGAKDKTTDLIETKIDVLKNGPLLVHGLLKVNLKDGSHEIKNRTTAFCRCGKSGDKPYCDGTHSKIDFVG